ncbi:GNAT family N-acetyltransferase [Dactylosporangium sp. NPDC050688]|uniref:GNAT family N-acetyltransferase n=1 Tax=Dactylosporangium sp. NPDC050688 TaxID=3157217 RepID=UPI0033FC6FF7
MAGVSLREVVDDDIEVFFADQQDPVAARMAAVAPREREAFLAHWTRVRADPSNIMRTVVAGDAVAGNMVSWDQAGERLVGYWIGRDHWGRGVATAALRQFLDLLPAGPVHAYVATANTGSIRVLHKCGFHLAGPPVTAGDGIEEVHFVRD